MDYRQGSIGRVFVVRFDDGDDFLGGLKDIVLKEHITQAWFQILGGIRQADVVTGPREPVMPPEPVWQSVDGARETIGTGSIFWEGGTPRIHLHTVMGHHGDTLCACMRENTRVYLVLEVCIFEITGMAAARPWFTNGGFNRLTFI